MGYVLTPEEAAVYREYGGAAYAVGKASLEVEFATTASFVREVLPPCYEPAREPKGIVSIGRSWAEDDQVRPIPGSAYTSTSISVAASYHGVEGRYPLVMVVDDGQAITTGRESWGEPKKHGRSDLLATGRRMYGYCERRRTRIVEVEAELGDAELGPRVVVWHGLQLKGWLTPDRQDIQGDPAVVIAEVTCAYRSVREGTAVLAFFGTARDPVDTIPVASVGRATWAVGSVQARATEFTTLAQVDREVYYRHLVGRNDDARIALEPA